MTPQQAKAILKDLASDGSRVFFTRHAEERMVEREITRTQVLRCLERGSFEENPARDVRGSWAMRLKLFTAGEYIRVALAIDQDKDGNLAVIITVI
ncbi:MAG: DUF4258 domain-containing protein [Thiothrix sp.]|uniref:DUF4258 domain-containing protein n=1 Tax=Thiothrix sp. TaxID=1032 RepID=UPI002610F1F8|nr:DUF4258 domain-containing protein [Thiothrix sp.]MDD5394391.1 DUF4258 domain-containing protein [Thiothrix sp.]